MPCYSPLKGYKSRERTENGKRKFVFSHSEGYEDLKQEVECGVCIGCRLKKSREWAMRCVHEASLYEDNCFITLTFNDEHLKPSLDKDDFVKFMKRLRKRYQRSKEDNIRYYHCGEYGSKLGRPHHHACLFNIDFKDKKLWTVKDGVRLYRSEELESLWTHPETKKSLGFSTIGEVNFESAAYVARYVTKKIKGNAAKEHYRHVCKETGLITYREPEYHTMSRMPGLGLKWLEKYKEDVYPSDLVILRNNLKIKPPEYYDRKYEEWFPERMEEIRAKRRAKMKENAEEYSEERLETKMKIKLRKMKLLMRSLENEATSVRD
jgi:hypothetical protein